MIAVKGLYLLAQDLRLFPLYESLLEIYEDLTYEMYGDALPHYEDVLAIYEKLRGVFYV